MQKQLSFKVEAAALLTNFIVLNLIKLKHNSVCRAKFEPKKKVYEDVEQKNTATQQNYHCVIKYMTLIKYQLTGSANFPRNFAFSLFPSIIRFQKLPETVKHKILLDQILSQSHTHTEKQHRKFSM